MALYSLFTDTMQMKHMGLPKWLGKRRLLALPFFIESSALTLNFSKFCQHCQVTKTIG